MIAGAARRGRHDSRSGSGTPLAGSRPLCSSLSNPDVVDRRRPGEAHDEMSSRESLAGGVPKHHRLICAASALDRGVCYSCGVPETAPIFRDCVALCTLGALQLQPFRAPPYYSEQLTIVDSVLAHGFQACRQDETV